MTLLSSLRQLRIGKGNVWSAQLETMSVLGPRAMASASAEAMVLMTTTTQTRRGSSESLGRATRIENGSVRLIALHILHRCIV